MQLTIKYILICLFIGTGPEFTDRSLSVKKRIKEFQRKHLLAAHEALWAVLSEMKANGEVN